MKHLHVLRIACGLLLLIGSITFAAADEATATDEAGRRKTAVALNYCRAAFHRIRQTPSKRVLWEERQRILNNVDLNGIADEEVIDLYASVLDEINQVEIAEKERLVISEQHKRGLRRQLVSDFFIIGTQVATGQMADAIRSGSNSWWDFRLRQLKRDVDVWTIDRKRMVTLVSRSSEFLNAFWKLSRRNSIPDEWLVRENDLERLAAVLGEHDAQLRLRVLRRMERFMTCYPPYWYHLGRTQQELGRFDEASETYQALAELGAGFFRQDDMLASATANLAVIQEHLEDPAAAETAIAALKYSNAVWEANLMCAWVLGRNDEFAGAEDAVLSNLDADLETRQSSVALVSLYYHSGESGKLAALLERPEVVAQVPIPGLLLSASIIGGDGLTAVAQRQLQDSLSTSIESRHGRNEVRLIARPSWKLSEAQLTLTVDGTPMTESRLVATANRAEVRFLANRDLSDSLLVLNIKYPKTPDIRIHLESESPRSHQVFRFPTGNLRTNALLQTPREYRMSSVEVGAKRITLVSRRNRA